tara:strand:- start:240 stop:542 length:303 start_codon:yes stop_codon:yes gene_type:complete
MKKVQDVINAMPDDEIETSLKIRKTYRKEKYPIIKIREAEFKCEEDSKGNIFLLWRAEDLDWGDVEDLTDFTVYEYNELVEKLNTHYPDYPIEYLEGRFV